MSKRKQKKTRENNDFFRQIAPWKNHVHPSLTIPKKIAWVASNAYRNFQVGPLRWDKTNPCKRRQPLLGAWKNPPCIWPTRLLTSKTFNLNSKRLILTPFWNLKAKKKGTKHTHLKQGCLSRLQILRLFVLWHIFVRVTFSEDGKGCVFYCEHWKKSTFMLDVWVPLRFLQLFRLDSQPTRTTETSTSTIWTCFLKARANKKWILPSKTNEYLLIFNGWFRWFISFQRKWSPFWGHVNFRGVTSLFKTRLITCSKTALIWLVEGATRNVHLARTLDP